MIGKILTNENFVFLKNTLDFSPCINYNSLNTLIYINSMKGKRLFFSAQRAGGWCEPV